MNKMSINKSNVRSLAAVIVAALILPSCVNLDENQGEGVGYLELPGLTADVEVYELVPTKSGTTTLSALGVTGYNAPDIAHIAFTLTGPESYSKTWTGALTETLELPVGTYTLSGKYDNAGNDGLGEALYDDFSCEVAISPQGTVTPEIKLPLINSLVAVTLPDMSGHMEVESISLSDGTESIPIESGTYYFVPAGKEVTVSFSGTNELDNPKSVVLSLGTLEAQRAYDVEYTLDLPSFTFADQSSGAIAGRLYLTSLASIGDNLDESDIYYQISVDGGSSWEAVEPVGKDGYWVISQTEEGNPLESDGTSYQIRAVYGGLIAGPWTFTPSMPENTLTRVEITHNYDSSVLIGSTATIGGTDIGYPEIVANLISSKGSRGVKLQYGTTDVRTLSGKEAGAMTVVGNWPYLPQGEYTATPYFTIGDDTFDFNPLEVTRVNPVFTVTAYAETSYSRYTSTDATLKAKANDSGTGDQVMNIKGMVSISDDIVNKYPGLISNVTLKYNDNTLLSSGTTVSSNTWYPNTLATKESDTSWKMTGQEWRSHTLTATFTFDGVAAKSSTDPTSTVSTLQCHITGLPYSKDFKTDSSDTGWTFVEKNYNDSYSRDYKSGVGYLMYYAYTTDKGCNLFSPTFYIPQDIDVAYSATFSAGTTLHKDKSYTIYTGVTSGTTVKQDISATINEKTYCGTSGYNSKQISATSEMTNQKNRLCFSHNADLSWGQGSEHYIYFGSFTLNYR